MVPLSKVTFDLTSVLSSLAQDAVLMETRGLSRCLLTEGTNSSTGEKQTLLNTEGINLQELFQYSEVGTITAVLQYCYCCTTTTAHYCRSSSSTLRCSSTAVLLLLEYLCVHYYSVFPL